MKKNLYFLLAGIALSITLTGKANIIRETGKVEDLPVPLAAQAEVKEEIITLPDARAAGENEEGMAVNPQGKTLEDRFPAPAGYLRVLKPSGSLQGYLRLYTMKPDESPVLLYNGNPKKNQESHAAVFSMPMVEGDLQQCADSVIRIYGEYLWSMGAYDAIKFHLTNGFLMDYGSWRSGKRLKVSGNRVTWVQKAAYDDSKESFLSYLREVMVYAGTLSLDKESVEIKPQEIQAGDLFIKGGSPGHCVMVVDVAQDQAGNLCFLLAQGYMPAQEFHVLKNPLHPEDPWYYITELKYPLATPEYVFDEGSLKRWKGFAE